MKLSDRLLPMLVGGVLLAGVGMLAWRWLSPKDEAIANVRVPSLSVLAQSGKTAFDANCAECHGKNAAGSKKGPPLVHDIYNPGHHNDQAFFRAAKRGVQQHHWPFGNMPARKGVTDQQLAAIVQYVRELQQANGIFFRPHKM